MNDESMPKTDSEWKEKLTPEEYHIMREKGTEPPFSGAYYHNKEPGLYLCKACGNELFSSDTKYDSGSGWPSFWSAIADKNVKTQEDSSHGMQRVEVTCNRCGAHLGHVFEDGPNPTGKRFCINSTCLDFKKKE